MKVENQVIKVKEPKIKKTVNKEGLIIGIIVALVVLITAGIVAYYFYFADNESVVTYDGGKITRGEYEMYYTMFAPWLSYYGYDSEKISTYIAEKIVLDKLVFAKATEEGYKLTDDEKKEVDEMFANEDEVKSIKEQGIDPEKLKAIYYNDAVISAYIEDLEKAATAEDVKAYILEKEGKTADLNIYNTSHILFKFEDGMKDDAKAELLVKAKKILTKAKSGSDFATLAKDNSDDSSSTDGGKVTVTNNGSVYEEYMNAVKKLKAGQIYSDIVESQAGYHIIKLNSIDKDGRLTNEDDISEYVNSTLYDMQEKSNYKINEDRLEAVSSKLATTLGLNATDETGTDTESTESTESTEAK